MRPRTILHVDMDAFYVSVERLLNPELEGKAVVVGGPPQSRGVVCSASYEARKYGVRSAMPSAQAARLCPHAIFVSSGFSHYSEYSRRIREIMLQFTPLVKMASQDEAYMDMTGSERLFGPPPEMGRAVKDRIRAETGLPCSVGVTTSRLVSKIASGHCKPDGLLHVPAGSEAEFLAPLPVGKMPGIGPKTQERMAQLNLKTLGHLQRLSEADARRLFGERAAELQARARGEDDSPVEPDSGPPKSISHETTFGEDVRDRETLDRVMAELSEKVARRLRRKGLYAATVGIKFRYENFETHTAAQTLPSPTMDHRDVREAARELLGVKWQEGRALRLVGVVASNLGGSAADQLDLLAGPPERNEKRERLLKAMDALKDKYGDRAVRDASS